MALHPLTIEICVEGIDGLVTAQEAGADRVELCASLLEGGITPSIGMIEMALRVATIPFHPIIRPRGGDFLYSPLEFESMLADVRAIGALGGVAGVVVGCLTADGQIDEARTNALVSAAGPMSVNYHRAFDMTGDPGEALEALIRCGVQRVLTSGQHDSALAGAEILRKTHEQAAGRIAIMACGRLNAGNIAQVRRQTLVSEMHFSAPKTVKSGMNFRNPGVGMGGTALEREYELTLSDGAAIAATIGAAKAADV
jgi:copper homeostasis protein